MVKVAKDYGTLYQREYPYHPGRLLTTQIDLFHINNDVPSEAEVEAEVRQLHPHKSGGHTQIHTENLKTWLREAYPG